MRSARVPSLPAIGSERRKARPSGCASIAISSRPTLRGDARFGRVQPGAVAGADPSPSWRAKRSAFWRRRCVVPCAPRARREPLEQHLGEEVVRVLVRRLDQGGELGEPTVPSGSRRERSPGSLARPTLPLDADPALSRPSLQRAPRRAPAWPRSRRRRARAVGEAGERPTVGARPRCRHAAAAVEDVSSARMPP